MRGRTLRCCGVARRGVGDDRLGEGRVGAADLEQLRARIMRAGRVGTTGKGRRGTREEGGGSDALWEAAPPRLCGRARDHRGSLRRRCRRRTCRPSKS